MSRHDADNWGGEDMPGLVYLRWPREENRTPRHALSDNWGFKPILPRSNEPPWEPLPHFVQIRINLHGGAFK